MRIFTGKGTVGYMHWAAIVQSTEVKGYSSDPDCHLTKLSVGRGFIFVL